MAGPLEFEMVRKFLIALFTHCLSGFIEVRLIGEGRRGKRIERFWYANVEELLADLPRLLALAEEMEAGIFFGVLPRSARGVGKGEDTLPGMAVWVDMDYHDFADGEAECRRILGAFPLPASIVNRSGHGLHGFWLFREPLEPQELSRLSRGLAEALGGDHAWDAPRVLRLPGTLNRKDAANPILVEIEKFDPDLRYNPSDFEGHLPPGAATAQLAAAVTPEPEAQTIVIAPEISARVRSLLARHSRIQNLFEGKGKPLIDREGRRLDTSSSGYDFSVVLALAREGVDDPAELAAVLWHRLDDAARTKGLAYVGHTVLAALAQVQAEPTSVRGGRRAADEITQGPDFEVDEIREYLCDPRRYELKIEGKTLTLSARQLLTRSHFRLRFVEALGRVPKLPDPGSWGGWVDELLARATKVILPPEASGDGELNEEIQLAIEGLTIGEEREDLDHGLALMIKGSRVFKSRTIVAILKAAGHRATNTQVCVQLIKLGYESGSQRIDGQVVRVWAEREPKGAEPAPPPEPGA